ncbi:YegP family protein [Desulfobotulus mexicanus]|uniref:DUF1508 domain-containing protein n=1 Tax=Desulfobotulus mexicanus TaxID=2586642 RepID=A0A5S5MCM8_9BACT|nr:DUF1508 domain-containing protein [Desulfobotulus mexicanus]
MTGIDKGTCEIYKGNDNKWWWRSVAANGKIVAGSTQGYVNKSDCIANAKMQGYSGCTGS